MSRRRAAGACLLIATLGAVAVHSSAVVAHASSLLAASGSWDTTNPSDSVQRLQTVTGAGFTSNAWTVDVTGSYELHAQGFYLGCSPSFVSTQASLNGAGYGNENPGHYGAGSGYEGLDYQLVVEATAGDRLGLQQKDNGSCRIVGSVWITRLDLPAAAATPTPSPSSSPTPTPSPSPSSSPSSTPVAVVISGYTADGTAPLISLQETIIVVGALSLALLAALVGRRVVRG
jgi:hypothetical protein